MMNPVFPNPCQPSRNFIFFVTETGQRSYKFTLYHPNDKADQFEIRDYNTSWMVYNDFNPANYYHAQAFLLFSRFHKL